jgi:hypothetical protein
MKQVEDLLEAPAGHPQVVYRIGVVARERARLERYQKFKLAQGQLAGFLPSLG